MAEHPNQDEQDELDERLGDLWSMNRAEQDYASRIILAASIGFIVALVCGACFVVFR